MKKIKIFLASSVNEFKNERNMIGDLIRQIQDKVIDEGIKINLFECEFFDNNISAIGRKQEEYNEEIKKSDIFIMLIGSKAGEFTVEEYKVAEKVQGLQRHIIFKNCECDESVINFKKTLNSSDYIYNYKETVELKNIINNIIKFFWA